MGDLSDTDPLDVIGRWVSLWLKVPRESLLDGAPILDDCCPDEKGLPKFDDGFPNTVWSGDTLAVFSDDPKGLIEAPNADVGLSSTNGVDGGPLLKGEKSSFLLKRLGLELGSDPDTKGDERCLVVEPKGDGVICSGADPNGGEVGLDVDPKGDVGDLDADPKGE